VSGYVLLLPILIPIAAALCIFLLPKTDRVVKVAFTLVATAANLMLAVLLWGREALLNAPWGGYGMAFQLRLYEFSAFILLAAAGFALLIALYCASAMKGKPLTRQFYAFMLLTLGFVDGAVLANNLVVMLFFWEGLLAMLFAFILTGGVKASPTAVKALVLNGAADLCLMLGIGMYAYVSGTLQMNAATLPLKSGLSIASFALMMVGAIAKAGSMPFHSWIPDAATDAPTPFMAFLPAALEKLLGIYLLARITLDLFDFNSGSTLSVVMMSIGVVTILLAVMMALIQKDYKRLLSYHAISQVGYMILGIGTALPVGIVGGLFHMINHAMYKSGLFLTAGAVEKQTGTTDLKALGGLARKMPVTFACFLVTAAAISGVPPFNGFYSKELIFDGALESGWIFYAGAALGAFFTAASFLKLGHAAYFGKPTGATEKVKEAPWPMLAPMLVLAALCTLFGVWNALPLNNLIQPILGTRLEGESFAGILPLNAMLAAISVAVLLLAVANHAWGVKRTGRGLGAVDHIHYAPGLKQVYDAAEKRWFDPYDLGMVVIRGFSKLLFWIDRGIDWVYNKALAAIVGALSWLVRKPHNGTHWMYILWALGGTVLVGVIMMSVF
jgi:formate hydrogenlyase subunit 3/multisubunit Na+/H+ antiporter MnhD subunit